MISSTSLGAFSGTSSSRPAAGSASAGRVGGAQAGTTQTAAPARSLATVASTSSTGPDPTLRRGSLLDIQA